MRTFTRPATAAFAAGVLLALAACGDDSEPAPAGTAAGSASAAGGLTPAAAGGAQDLSDVCPATVIVQTDWNPEAEHGGLYQIVGPGYSVDKGGLRVTGPLVDGDVDTGVDIEVRAGGPAIGFQQVTAQMYTDPEITLGYIFTDEAVQNSAEQPTLAVLAPLEINPQMIMWDPATYPDFTSVQDIGRTDTTVLYFEGGTYMEYLLGEGILKDSQIDASYDGSPARFVAENGAVTQQGFATAEPYIYENEVADWGKPVQYQLVHDMGYQPYASTISILPERKAELAPCLEKLVPIMQKGSLGYVDDPSAANSLILELVRIYDNGWVYSQGVADFAAEKMAELEIVSNGPDRTLGNFDTARVQGLIDLLEPILAARNAPIAADLVPDDIVTNEFIDDSIGLK